MTAGMNYEKSSENAQDAQACLFENERGGEAIMENWRSYFPDIVGRSAMMMKVLPLVSKVARSDSSVLIYGESGTGKELIARAIHRLSSRSAKKFITINCSAIPENLLESELFGHEKGAFTGAHSRRPGIFEVAAGGTILLDEIGDMPLHLQAKLLRVLQEKQFTPVGSNEVKRADVRIVAATNVDLQSAVDNKRFRLDLFYRLNVVPIHIPPLRERHGDVPLLLDHFLEVAQRKHPVSQACYFQEDAMEVLLAHHWPGNVRELQNLVERLVVITGGGPISLHLLPVELQKQAEMTSETSLPSLAWSGDNQGEREGQENTQALTNFGMFAGALGRLAELPEQGLDLGQFIESLENELILQALARTDNNKQKAAKLLGMNRTTLVERLKKRKIGSLNTPSLAK